MIVKYSINDNENKYYTRAIIRNVYFLKNKDLRHEIINLKKLCYFYVMMCNFQLGGTSNKECLIITSQLCGVACAIYSTFFFLYC